MTADILGFTDSLTAAIRAALAEAVGLRPAAILLASSHTHSGPQTCENMASAGGLPDPAYLAALREQIVAAVREAQSQSEQVTMEVGFGTLTGYAINRRGWLDGEMSMIPNAEGVRDDEVTVVTFRGEEGSVKGVLFHYTCHPTLMGDLRITGDYPGAARRTIEKTLEGAAAGFLPGCFGDVRPNCVLVGGRQFRRAIPADVEEFGKALGSEVARLLTFVPIPLRRASTRARRT